MSEIEKAIRQICDEKNIPYEAVIGTIEAALAAAYRKDFGEKNQNIKVEFNPETAGSRVFDEKTAVADEMYEEALKLAEEREQLRAEGKLDRAEMTEEEREKEKELLTYPKFHTPLTEAKKIKKDAEVGEILNIELEVPEAYGRMAAQTAKQVIIQRLRETEREILYDEFKEQEGSIAIAMVQRKEGRVILLDIGKATAIMIPEDQTPREFYKPGQRLKVYVKSVESSPKGPEILVSRTHPDIVAKLFESEIPEIASGAVEIKGVAREAGSRSKVAVISTEANIDPIGSCIGQRGARIQTVINELGGEKVDIIMYSEDPAVFITNSLSPAKVISLEVNEKEKSVVALVAPDQFSLAIGKNGQNVRLAAKLTGWRISVKEDREDGVKPAEISVAPEEGESPEHENIKTIKQEEGEKEDKKEEEKKEEMVPSLEVPSKTLETPSDEESKKEPKEEKPKKKAPKKEKKKAEEEASAEEKPEEVKEEKEE
ncbi:transcription termination factor NusA [Patescibacteria group bacterium]|nr:transcription termination factor NusA [Patescibacteria group bacterium]